MARENGVTVWSDEIFGDTPLDGSRVPVFAALAEEDDRVVSVISMGKTFSLTGVNHANVIIRNPSLRAAYEAQRNADHFGSIDPDGLRRPLRGVYAGGEGVALPDAGGSEGEQRPADPVFLPNTCRRSGFCSRRRPMSSGRTFRGWGLMKKNCLIS